MKNTPRVLGIDYGEKRMGIAISDPLGITAQPLTTIICKNESSLEKLQTFMIAYSVKLIVIGFPLNMNGTQSSKSEKIKLFGDLLTEKLHVPVKYMDERLTTLSAQRTLNLTKLSGTKKKQVIDKLAATLILQTWLDREKNTA